MSARHSNLKAETLSVEEAEEFRRRALDQALAGFRPLCLELIEKKYPAGIKPEEYPEAFELLWKAALQIRFSVEQPITLISPDPLDDDA